MKHHKAKTIAYWIFTILGPTSFIIGGVVNFIGGEQPTAQMLHLGYPLYVMQIIGFWKIGGAIVCTVPRLPLLKEWAYAGFLFDLTGAAASHAFNGDPFLPSGPASVLVPLIFLAFVAASWILRPPSRRLPGTDVFKVWS